MLTAGQIAQFERDGVVVAPDVLPADALRDLRSEYEELLNRLYAGWEGGAVVFHPLTPHSSLANCSEDFRWSFDLRYNVTGQPTGRAHFPEFVARSRRDPSQELTDWRELRRMWEDARARLSDRAHIPIHRWRGDSPACA